MMVKYISAMLLLTAMLSGCGEPHGTLHRYTAAKSVVDRTDMKPLVSMLLSGDVAGFNRLRTNAPYMGRRLDFTGISFAGLNLKGANFSDAILATVDFTGANLDRASFRNSYVATAWLARTRSLTIRQDHAPTYLPAEVSTNIGRPTSLVQADFTGAVLKAKEYYYDCSEGFCGWMSGQVGLSGIQQAVCIGTIGIEPLSVVNTNWHDKVRVIGQTKSVSIPQNTPKDAPDYSQEHVRSASELGAACRNPFLDVEQHDLPCWNAPGVSWRTLTNLPAVRVRGEYYGARMIDLVHCNIDF